MVIMVTVYMVMLYRYMFYDCHIWKVRSCFLTFGPWGPSGPWPFVMLSTGSLHIIYVVAPAAKGLSK